MCASFARRASSSRARFSAVCAAYHAAACAVCATRRAPASRSSPSNFCALETPARGSSSPSLAGRASRFPLGSLRSNSRRVSFAWCSARKRATFRSSSFAIPRLSCSNITSRRSSVFASTSCARSRSSSAARRAAFSATCASSAATSTCRIRSKGRASSCGCSEEGQRRAVDGRRRSRGRGCRKWFPRRSIQHGAKRNRRSGTHPRRAPLGVVHERQSVPRVETLRAGEAVAPDQGENHGRGRERARRGVNETTSSQNY